MRLAEIGMLITVECAICRQPLGRVGPEPHRQIEREQRVERERVGFGIPRSGRVDVRMIINRANPANSRGQCGIDERALTG